MVMFAREIMDFSSFFWQKLEAEEIAFWTHLRLYPKRFNGDLARSDSFGFTDGDVNNYGTIKLMDLNYHIFSV